MNAAYALFTKTQRAVLAAVYQAAPEGVMFAEVVRASGGGFGGTQKVLQSFLEAGLISCRKFGNQRRYSPNLEHPIGRDLKNIVDKTLGFVAVLHDALALNIDQIELAFVFGSVARERERADSDIDLGIIGSVSRRDLALPMQEAEKLLGRPINMMLSESADRFLQLFQLASRAALDEAVRRGEFVFVAGTLGGGATAVAQGGRSRKREIAHAR